MCKSTHMHETTFGICEAECQDSNHVAAAQRNQTNRNQTRKRCRLTKLTSLAYIYIYIYIYIWSPPPPGPTFSHPRRGRCHRDIYNKIVHSTETMEKTVKNEHLSIWKLICTESKNCCKSVLFRPKFGLESHGLKYIWYHPKKHLPLCMFYWYLHLWFDYVIKKQKKLKNLEKTKKNKKKQYSRTLAKTKIQKTSRKPKKTKKSKKNNIPGLLQK